MALTDKLTAIANAIRGKTGKSGKLTLDAMPAEIAAIGSGGELPRYEILYEDTVPIAYTSSSAGTALSIQGMPSDIAKYAFIIVDIANTDKTKKSLKFIESITVICNRGFKNGTITGTSRYGTMLYYDSTGALYGATSTTYGLFGYSYTTSTLTIRGRTYASSYFEDLTGTYDIRVIGVIW